MPCFIVVSLPFMRRRRRVLPDPSPPGYHRRQGVDRSAQSHKRQRTCSHARTQENGRGKAGQGRPGHARAEQSYAKRERGGPEGNVQSKQHRIGRNGERGRHLEGTARQCNATQTRTRPSSTWHTKRKMNGQEDAGQHTPVQPLRSWRRGSSPTTRLPLSGVFFLSFFLSFLLLCPSF
jgi:hypothetical protein